METRQSKSVAESFGYGICNPVIRRMHKATTKETTVDDSKASYAGIFGKSAYFIIMAIVGVGAYFLLHQLVFKKLGIMPVVASSEKSIFELDSYVPELITAGATALIAIFLPLIALFVRKAIPVVGTLYCVCEGYLIGFITSIIIKPYQWASLLALVLTISVVGVMAILYFSGAVKVGQKFKTFMLTLVITVAASSLIVFLLNIIPFTSVYMAPMMTFLNSPVVSILVGLVYLIIAILFLLCDFDTIRECVDNGMDKSYEWMAAWGLAYTIIYIYIKILNLILRILGASKRS